jgi:hypothetical protein
MDRFVSRRSLYLVFGVALVALGFMVSGGFAHSGPNYAKADIHKDNATDPVTDCGPGGTSKKIGSATFTTKKGLLTVVGKIHGGVPGSYDVDLYRLDGGGGCELVAGKDFKVDGSGDGDFSGSIPMCGSDFFLDVHNQDTDVHNLSDVVHLGSLSSCIGTTTANT